MALVPNPLTGELEENGLPEDPLATQLDASPLPAMDQPAQGPVGGGTALGTPENPMVATIAPQPKPPLEIVSETRTVTPSKAETEAAAELDVANTLVSQAAKSDTATAQEEAKINEQLAGRKVELLEEQKVRNWELEQEEKREQEAIKTRARTLAEDRAKKQIAAGRARADYFKGNFVGEIVAALVQSVAAGLHAMTGKEGPSPAERIFEKKYQDHEKALLAEYEASKQAEDHFRNDRPRWEAERAARRTKAAQDALHDVNIALAVADRSLARRGPDKVANAAAMKEALRRQADAKFDLEVSKGLRTISDYQKTSRPMGDGTGEGGSDPTGGLNPVLHPYTGKVIAQLPKERMVEGRQARDAQGALNGLRTWNTKFKDFLQKNGPVMSKYSPEARNQLKTFATEGAGLLTIANQTGVLNQGEYDRYIEQMTPQGILGLFSSQNAVDRGLDEIVKGAERKQVGKVKALVPGMDIKDPNEKAVTKPDWPEGERRKVAGKIYQMKNGKPVLVK